MYPTFQPPEFGVQTPGDLSIIANGTDLDLGALFNFLQPALEFLKPAIDYVVKNPWVLLPIMLPLLDAWLVLLGFEAGGIAAGRIALLLPLASSSQSSSVHGCLLAQPAIR